MALILLPSNNQVFQESLQHKLEAVKKEPCDAKLYDFDDVFYRIFVDPKDRTKMLISLETSNWIDIKSKGAEDLIKEKLGQYVKDVSDNGINFEINLEDEKTSEGAQKISELFGKLRIYALGGPLSVYAKALANNKPLSEPFSFQLRRDTHMWIVPKNDRITVVLGFEFPIKSDYIIANQILTEFVEVRRQKELSNTPVISYSQEPPLELKGLKIPNFGKDIFLGYFSILLLPDHIKGNKIDTAIANVIGFRSYLTYHIKCAKAFFHSSMRNQVKSMLQILNRARYEEDESRKKKKVISGAK